MITLPGKSGSCWVASAGEVGAEALNGRIETETVVIGGGIVGLSAALRLCELGRPVVVLEALKIGEQVTGRSTAKITTQHGLIYRHLIDTFGLDTARTYAEANKTGAAWIREWVQRHRIACDLEPRSAYTYFADNRRDDEIEGEVEAVRQVGLQATVEKHAPLPFETGSALCFPNQAQFNPAKYLTGLAETVTRLGGLVLEHSRATEIEEDGSGWWRATTKNGQIRAENIVIATNMTVKSPVGMSHRTQPRSHIALAYRVDDPILIDGMFLGIGEEGHSLRMGSDDAGPLLIALGPKFNTGQDGNVAQRFLELDSWINERLPVRDAIWRWCNEDYDTADRIPYAGMPDPGEAPGFYIATGFNAWGISNGTATGLMIAGAIGDDPTGWESLYDPTRPYPEDFHQSGDSMSIVSSLDEIRPGEGGVLKRGEEMLAVWRDEAGECHAVSASCTHKGCTLTWNNADRTWDCPCHGSIFASDGSVIHAPARKPLAPAKL